MNRHKINCTKPTIDPSHQLVHSRSQILILFDVLPGWHCQLHEDYFSNPFGVLCQEDLESVHLLWNTLDVVKTINADDDFASLETLLELCYPRLDFWLLNTLPHH
jgi:hypothetical protein